MLNNHKIISIIVLVLIASACSRADVGAGDLYGVRQAMMHGHAAPDSDYGGVVAIGIRTGGDVVNYCSGTLIAQDVVLTAAHCVTDDAQFPFNRLFNDGRIVATVGENSLSPSDEDVFQAVGLSVYPRFRHASNEHDVALLWLDGDVPPGKALPIPVLQDSGVITSMEQGHVRFEGVGYGVDEEGHDGVRLWAEGFIGRYCQIGEGTCKYVNSYGEVMEFPDGTIIYDLGKGGPCNGDSGGPLLVDVDGQRNVMGIISYGDGNCVSYAVAYAAPDYYQWMMGQLGRNADIGGDGCSIGKNLVPKEPSVPLVLFMFLGGMMLGIRARKK